MKNFLYVILASLALMTAACGSNNDGQADNEQTESNSEAQESNMMEEEATQKDEGNSTELTSGINEVLASLDELKTLTTESPDNTEQIQKAGKVVGESWDEIEEQVEEKYPKEYEYIEKSLYPLKDVTKKDQLNIEKVKQLTDDTEKKVREFKEKL